MFKWCKLSIVMMPFLMGAKCIDYDANYAELAGVNISQVGEAGAAFDGSFVAADACPSANEAIIDVGDYYFAIVCGCLEEPGRILFSEGVAVALYLRERL